MVVRWLVAILLIGGFIAGLFLVWSNGTQQGIQLVPADVSVSTREPGDLAWCQQIWVIRGGLSFRPEPVLGGPLTSRFIPLMQSADRLVQADRRQQYGATLGMGPLVASYERACHSLLYDRA